MDVSDESWAPSPRVTFLLFLGVAWSVQYPNRFDQTMLTDSIRVRNDPQGAIFRKERVEGMRAL
jgi:hypothetical protein